MSVTDLQRMTAAHEGRRIGYMHYPYGFGVAGPNEYDCSGLTMAAWAKARVTLPHNSAQQAVLLKAVPWKQANIAKMQPGDLVFFQGDGGDTVASVGHVAMYLEEYEGMHIIAQATNTQLGSEVIRVKKYEQPLFIGYVR